MTGAASRAPWGVLPLSLSLLVPPLPASNRTSPFKSETASRSGRGGGGRGEAPPRGPAPGGGPAPATEREPLHAVEAYDKRN